MSEQTIVCPNCGKRIPISKALTVQIEADLRKTFDAQAERQEEEAQATFEKRLAAETARLGKQARKEAEQAASVELSKMQRELADAQKREKTTQASFERRLTEEKSRLERQARKAVEAQVSEEMADLQKQLEEKDEQVAEVQKLQSEIQKRQTQLAAREKSIETEITRRTEKTLSKMQRELADAQKREKTIQASFERRLTEEKSRLERQARKAVEAQVSEEMAELQKQLEEKDEQVAEVQKLRSEIQRRQTQLTAREKSIETEITRRTEKAVRGTREEIEEEYRSHELELEKKLSDAKLQASELKRKLEQSSQQAQGEVVELALEKVLKKTFPEDVIEPIAKGKAGADVLQKVYTSNGQYCGAIIWESKNTQNWSKAWFGKLRNDQRRAKAEIAVLVSMTLPKDISHFAQVDGVWVTEFPLTIGVATALRTNLIQVAVLKQSSKGKQEKMELLYEYLSGTEFRQRVEAIVEAFRSMQDDLDKERQTMEKQWAKREKHIHLVIENVSGMYGDMQAIAGQSLPKIRRLELPAPSVP